MRAGVRPSSWAERIALILFGFLLALVVAEALLQIGAIYVRSTGGDRRAAWSGRERSVLCVGDSNTYGIRVERADAYPAVLERLWNGQAGRPAVQVLNLGVPGMNSSKLRNNFRALLASLHPDTVLVLIGANDPWTVPAAPDEEAEPTFAERLWQRSRVFRLLYMIDRGIRGVEPAPAPEVALEPARDEREGRLQGARAAVRLGARELDLTWTGKAEHRTSGWTRSLAVTLAAMRSAAAQNGSEIVLLTYASELRAYGAANEVIRAARADDLPVIDLGRVFTALCADGPCEELFFPDGHPTRLGYQIVAGVVWRELERLRGEPGTPHDQANWQAVLDDKARYRLAMAASLH